MQKTYFDFAITITLLFTIILSLLSPTLAYDDQQLAFANQQITMTKNQINNNNDDPANSNNSGIVPKVVFLSWSSFMRSIYKCQTNTGQIWI